MPAPAIAEAPSESELKRWNATVRSSSLFDESVVDPPPAAASDAARAAHAAPATDVRAMQATSRGSRRAAIETHEPSDAPMQRPR